MKTRLKELSMSKSLLSGKIAKKKKLVLGLNSGTSADGLDIALVEIRGEGPGSKVKFLNGRTFKYPKALHNKIVSYAEPEFRDGVKWMELDAKLAEFSSKAVTDFISEIGCKNRRIDFIGSHGQTIRHLAYNNRQPLTLQIGDPSRIAVGTGITTIGDFRVADTAAGGQGAPLTPIVNSILFGEKGGKTAVINIGGIANLTFLIYKDGQLKMFAGDCGPGNMVVDCLMKKLFGKSYDLNGRIASRGSADMAIINRLLKQVYFTTRGSKSAGREQFGTAYSERILNLCQIRNLSNDDIITTASRLTIECIIQFCRINRIVFERLLLCGGGVHNNYFLMNLKQFFPKKEIRLTDDFGYPADYLEAISFAILANETLCGNKYNLKNVTGAGQEVVLGKICPS